MSKPAISVQVFGIYLVVLAVTLTVAPNMLLEVFGIAAAREPWIRVLGVVVFVLGAYYVVAARRELMPFIRATVWGRMVVLLAFAGLVVLKLAPWQLVLFGLVDAAGAAWTALVLRARAGAV